MAMTLKNRLYNPDNHAAAPHSLPILTIINKNKTAVKPDRNDV